MLPVGLTFPQLTLALVVGVAGGLYIYKPLYKQYRLEQASAQGKAAPGGTDTDDPAPPQARPGGDGKAGGEAG
ncbi:protein PIGBOS1 [Rhinoraja longicauda]